MRTNKLIIRTPEGICFAQNLAGPVTRFLAFAIDLAGIGLISGLLSQVLLLTAVINTDFRSEGICFAQNLAGPVTRFLAFAIDLAGIGLISGLLSQVLLLTAVINTDFALAARTVCYFLVTVGYSIVLEWTWRGQTLGKRVLKIRVIDAEGLRLRPAQIVIRNLLRLVDLLPAFYAVGGICCALSRKFQRLGDFAANTVVIH